MEALLNLPTRNKENFSRYKQMNARQPAALQKQVSTSTMHTTPVRAPSTSDRRFAAQETSALPKFTPYTSSSDLPSMQGEADLAWRGAHVADSIWRCYEPMSLCVMCLCQTSCACQFTCSGRQREEEHPAQGILQNGPATGAAAKCRIYIVHPCACSLLSLKCMSTTLSV